jgi:hypothetical protein
MIARAKVDTDDPGIEYVIADLEHVALPESASFHVSLFGIKWCEIFFAIWRTLPSF